MSLSFLLIAMDDKKTPLLYRLIRRTAWLFFPKFSVAGAENIPDEPCVIVGNHCQMYGPVAAELYTPGSHYIWCVGEMMNRREVPAYAYQDFWSGKPASVRWFFKLASHMIAPLAEYIFNNAHTVAVYHDARVLTTFRDSVAWLQEGCSIVIFPEQHRERNNIIHEFQNRFVDLARFYYRKTGKELSFVPQYLAPRLKTIYYGRPVRYRHDAPIDQERKRICDAMMEEITSIAVSLPEHTVVPYPNIPKRLYPKNTPLVVCLNKEDAADEPESLQSRDGAHR